MYMYMLHHCVCIVCLQWTVQGKLRIGFFSVREILEREEITFDYQFQRFGYLIVCAYIVHYNLCVHVCINVQYMEITAH